MHSYPNSSFEAHTRSEQRSVVYRGHAPAQYSATGHGYGGSAQYGMSTEMRETSFVNEEYRRNPQSIQSIDQYPNDRLDHSYQRDNTQAIEPPGMGNPSTGGPFVESPSSSSMDETQVQTTSSEMMERAYVNEGYMHRPPSIQSIEQYPTNRMDHGYHYNNPQAMEQPGMANPCNHGIYVMPPCSPTMDGAREGENKKHRKTKRDSIRVILTRVCSAILVITDCVLDWMQSNDMTTPSDIISDISGYNGFTPQPIKECTSREDIAEKYKYFTIAGTVLSVIQLANIIFQIYSEVQFMREKKQAVEGNDSTQKKMRDKILKYPKKLLDGRTETLYSVLFIEIPQGLLLLRYQDACVSLCSKDLKGKHLSKRIWSAANGGIALLNNAFRYLTCSLMCEEEVEEDDKPGCCSGGGGGKCVGCIRCLFKCLCPCLCCFHRYECLMCGCWICGKKCICDMCQCYTEPWFCKVFCGICTFHYCPLVDPEKPMGAQKCCDVTSECCNCSNGCSDLFDYEPLVFNTSLATLFNVVYVFVYFGNICSTFCLELDYPIIKVIIDWILSAVSTLATTIF
ncbi:Hypothetical predicted protein [Mytilus galloprovincialis]|uniref:Uncharacterized protein n=1 Tax=Mytilus galloprovincialis TaxID=29158 RepID=A0A8B6GW39_MYTGA|nr:Hypothetical predicted protein [Mytilus galloprovincialis]